jgi:hypothetical protein
MNEADWLACQDPDRMLRYVLRHELASNWKRRCFVAACARRLWPMLQPRGREIVERGEQMLLEHAPARPGMPPDYDAQDLFVPSPHGILSDRHRMRTILSSLLDLPPDITPVAQAMRETFYYSGLPGYDALNCATRYALRDAEAAAQVQLVRELFGNPFRKVAFDPGWGTWRDGMIPRWARALLGMGRFDDLPILADALEEAGCIQPEILEHLRQEATHVRGCWAVDGLLAG